jgi:hypothetical protein
LLYDTVSILLVHLQVKQLQAELLAIQAKAKNESPLQEEARAATEALQGATEQCSQLQEEVVEVRKQLDNAVAAAASDNAQSGQHQIMRLVNSARDTVRTIAQTLGQPDPPSVGQISMNSTSASLADVLSTINAACTVAMAARRAWAIERNVLEDRAVQAAATGYMNATKDANNEESVMKEELLKLQVQLQLLQQREADLVAAQDRAKVQLPTRHLSLRLCN